MKTSTAGVSLLEWRMISVCLKGVWNTWILCVGHLLFTSLYGGWFLLWNSSAFSFCSMVLCWQITKLNTFPLPIYCSSWRNSWREHWCTPRNTYPFGWTTSFCTIPMSNYVMHTGSSQSIAFCHLWSQILLLIGIWQTAFKDNPRLFYATLRRGHLCIWSYCPLIFSDIYSYLHA